MAEALRMQTTTREIDKLQAEVRALGNLRVADMLHPEIEHDSVVDAEELTEPPRLMEAPID